MNTSYSSNGDHAIASFSPNDNWFYLYYPDKKEIEIYSSKALNRIHAFRYEDVDSVYWDSSNDVCISSRDKVYSWKPQNNKNRIFMGSYNIIYKVIETFLSFIFDLKLDIKHAEICLIVL